jgi:hypothetical protein
MPTVRIIMGRGVRLAGALHHVGDVVDVPNDDSALAGALRIGFVELVEEPPPTKPTRSELWSMVKAAGLDDGLSYRSTSADDLAALLEGAADD